MAAGDRLLCGRADHGGTLCPWFSVPWMVGVVSAGARRDHSVVADLDRHAPAVQLVFSRRSVLDRRLARLLALSQQVDLADHHFTRPQQPWRHNADDPAHQLIAPSKAGPARP